MKRIVFEYDTIKFRISDEKKISQVCCRIIKDYHFYLESLAIVLTKDESLVRINRQFFNKNDYTDIITFNYSEKSGIIDGELYISFERVVENTKKYSEKIDNELYRVIIHGVLHLVGENDDIECNILKMRGKEDHYLKLCFT